MYGCFISYARGHHELLKTVEAQLQAAIVKELDSYFDKNDCAFMDTEGIYAGDDWEKRIAKALCQSVCMIVVYHPRYKRSEPCRREFLAMERIEMERRKQLGAKLDKASGLIFPFLIRSEDTLPKPLQRRQYIDISDVTLASPQLPMTDQFAQRIKDIGRQVNRVYEALADKGLDRGERCDEFALPTPDEARPWSDDATVAQPLRES
jgi:TIR domain